MKLHYRNGDVVIIAEKVEFKYDGDDVYAVSYMDDNVIEAADYVFTEKDAIELFMLKMEKVQ